MDNVQNHYRNLQELDGKFKSHKRKRLLIAYGIRILIIMFLLLFIASMYTFYVGYTITKKLSSHKGAEQAKKALSEKPSTMEPFNVLVLGSDTRGEEKGRSDTIIILRVIPREKKAIMISIPRDYRVEIPGYGKRKINAAYALGGPELAIKTVSAYLNMPVHHYVAIDFQGFVEVVDALGGVTVNVEKRLYEQGDSNVNLYPGVQRLSGKQALSYVRFRHDEEGDFGRIRRQQQFIKALVEELSKPASIPKYPRISNIVAENVETDLSPSEIIELARYFAANRGFKVDSIMLPGYTKTLNGASFVIPEQAKVDLIISTILKENRLPRAEELIDPATISVKVFNGSGRAGVARAAANYLRDLNFNVLGSQNADKFDYEISLIVYKSGYKEHAEILQKAIGFGEVILSDDTYNRLLGSANVGLILGMDSLDNTEIKERMK